MNTFPQCGCGTFAIGRCVECGVPVCADHSALRDARRLCDSHWRIASQAAAARHRAEEDRSVEAFERTLDSFAKTANRFGSPGLSRFPLCPDKGWRGRSDKGWPILGPCRHGDGTAATYYLMRDGTVTLSIHTVRYISTGYQSGHYDPTLARSTGMRSGFRDPVHLRSSERAKLRPHADEIVASLRALADRHGLAWAP